MGTRQRLATQVGAKAKGSAAASWAASWAARPHLSHAGVLGSPHLPFCRAASLDRRRHSNHGDSQRVRTLAGPGATPRWRANCCTRRAMHQNVTRVMEQSTNVVSEGQISINRMELWRDTSRGSVNVDRTVLPKSSAEAQGTGGCQATGAPLQRQQEAGAAANRLACRGKLTQRKGPATADFGGAEA